jgi:hypothetical protein
LKTGIKLCVDGVFFVDASSHRLETVFILCSLHAQALVGFLVALSNPYNHFYIHPFYQFQTFYENKNVCFTYLKQMNKISTILVPIQINIY